MGDAQAPNLLRLFVLTTSNTHSVTLPSVAVVVLVLVLVLVLFRFVRNEKAYVDNSTKTKLHSRRKEVATYQEEK